MADRIVWNTSALRRSGFTEDEIVELRLSTGIDTDEPTILDLLDGEIALTDDADDDIWHSQSYHGDGRQRVYLTPSERDEIDRIAGEYLP